MSSSNAPGRRSSRTAGMMQLEPHGSEPCRSATRSSRARAPATVGLGMGNTGGATADCATVFGGATTLAQKEACVLDINDDPALGDVTFDDASRPFRPSAGRSAKAARSTFTVDGRRRRSVHLPVAPQRRTRSSARWRRAYMIAAAALGDAGSYDVVITNACGSEISPAALLTVNPLPVAPSSASSSPPSVCFGVGRQHHAHRRRAARARRSSGAPVRAAGRSSGRATASSSRRPRPTRPTSRRWTTVCGIERVREHPRHRPAAAPGQCRRALLDLLSRGGRGERHGERLGLGARGRPAARARSRARRHSSRATRRASPT